MKIRAPYAASHRLPTLLDELALITGELETALAELMPHPGGDGQDSLRGEALAALRRAETAASQAQRPVYRGSWEVELAADFKPVRSRWSPEMYSLLGFEPKLEASPELFLSIVPPDEQAKVLSEMAECVRKGGEYRVEHRIIRPDGIERVVLERARLIFDETGKQPTLLRGTCEDVTARGYRRSTKRYEQLLNNIKAGVVVHRGDGSIETFNQAACEILEVEATTLAGAGAAEREWTFFRADGTPMPESEFPVNLALARRSGVHGQIVGLTSRAGTTKWVQVNAEPVFDESGGRVEEVVATFMDISEQVRARALVDEGARFVRNVLDSMEKSVAVLDRAGRIALVNESWRRFAQENGGAGGNGYVGVNYLEICDRAARAGDRDAALAREGIEQVLRGERARFELEYACHSPTEQRWFLLRVSPLGAPYRGAVVAHIDVTERRKVQIAFNERDRQVSQLIANLPGFVFRCQNTPDWPVEFISDGVMGVLGYASKAFGTGGLTFAQVILPEDAQRVWWTIQQALARGERYEIEYRARHADGRIRWLWERGVGVFDPANGQLLFLEGISSDVSERKELEEQFRQAQKMDVMGQLAGGVAHDFNNLITVIMGHVELLQTTGQLPAPVLHSLGQIGAASDRAANLTRQLLAFSRKDAMTPRLLDLGAAVRDMTKMLRRMVGESYSITLGVPTEPIRAHVDGGMLDQVLMNLVVNARDAMRGGGQIDIELGPEVIDDATLPQHPGGRTGEFALLSVLDQGEGIKPEVLDKIFEPFFTTKPVGKGTGLGLATVLSIVRRHEGWVEVDSTVGVGTEFRIFLPLAREEAIASHEPTGVTPGGSETVLVVEDEDDVRCVLETVLRQKGYHVIAARSAPHAYDLWTESKADIALVVTDLILPDGMDGAGLIRVLHAERPGLPAIYTSGYVPDQLDRGLELREGENFLAKPFSAHDLLAVVRARLDQS